MLIVDPAGADGPPPAVPLEGDTSAMPLNGPAVLVSALFADGLALRRALDNWTESLERPGLGAGRSGEARAVASGAPPA